MSVVESEQRGTSLAQWTVNLYNLLLENAKVEEVEGEPLTVFRGSMTRTFNKLGCSQTYYTKTWRLLESANSITVLQKGARNTDSIIVLHEAPTVEMLDTWKDKNNFTERNTPQQLLAQRVTNIEAMIGGLNLKELAQNFEKRIAKLEQEAGE